MIQAVRGEFSWRNGIVSGGAGAHYSSRICRDKPGRPRRMNSVQLLPGEPGSVAAVFCKASQARQAWIAWLR